MISDRIYDFDIDSDRLRCLRVLDGLKGKWRIDFKRYRPRRSDAQNAYYWGVMIPHVKEGLAEAWGESLSSDEVHEYLKSLFLTKPIVNRRSGELVGTRPGSSSKLDVGEFIEYSDKVILWAAEYLGVEIPSPSRHGVHRGVAHV